MTGIGIELASREHLGTIPAIELAASAMFSEADLPPDIRYRVTDADTLYKAQSESRLWMALTGDRRPVGFAMTDTIAGAAHLEEMDVMPEFGRQGIGTRLLETTINWARDNHFARLTLVTFRHLPWNAPFYEKMGFVVMADSEIDDRLVSLLEEEGKAGIDVDKRVCMKLDFPANGSRS